MQLFMGCFPSSDLKRVESIEAVHGQKILVLKVLAVPKGPGKVLYSINCIIHHHRKHLTNLGKSILKSHKVQSIYIFQMYQYHKYIIIILVSASEATDS